MTTVAALLDIARSQLGVREDPPGSNDVAYTRWAHMVGQPWCDIFVSWCFDRAGMDGEGFHAYTPEHFQSFLDRGRGWHGAVGIQPGDVLFYDFPGGPDRISHTGFAETAWDGSKVTTIEGNTDAAGGRTGGQVYRHVRTSSIVGYGRPEYTTTEDIDIMDPDTRAYFDSKFLALAVDLDAVKAETENLKKRTRLTRRIVRAVAHKVGVTQAEIDSQA